MLRRAARPGAVGLALALAALAALDARPAAAAPSLTDPRNQWLPSVDGASWTYEWSDSAFAPVPTRERYTMTRRSGAGFLLTWSTLGLGNPEGAKTSVGRLGYRRTLGGLVNPASVSNPPAQPGFPSLCASAANCSESLASTHLMLAWGSRAPVLAEPLVRGARWRSVGGTTGKVTSTNRYLGRERVVVGAFPGGVQAAKVRSVVSRGRSARGAYGTGTRTVWWVYGVGPVKVVFDHPGPAISRAELKETTLAPRTSPRRPATARSAALSAEPRRTQADTPPPAPPEDSPFPLVDGATATFRWRNAKHMPRSSTQRFEVTAAQAGAGQVVVRELSGPIVVRGGYVFGTRLDGVFSNSAFVRSATRAKLPALGPRTRPVSRRRRFATPYDLMTFGFNPIVPAFPKVGDQWTSQRGSRDFAVYGVTGRSRVTAVAPVRTPAGVFRAFAVRSDLSQPGFRFGSGTRTSWFAPGRGLVKLVFRHRDGSVSTVERVR